MALISAADYKLTDVSRANIEGRPFSVREGAARALVKSEDIAYLVEGLRERWNVSGDKNPDLRITGGNLPRVYSIPERFDIASRSDVGFMKLAFNDVFAPHTYDISGKRCAFVADDPYLVIAPTRERPLYSSSINRWHNLLDTPEAPSWLPEPFPFRGTSRILTVAEMADLYSTLSVARRVYMDFDTTLGTPGKFFATGAHSTLTYYTLRASFVSPDKEYKTEYDHLYGGYIDYCHFYGGGYASTAAEKPYFIYSYQQSSSYAPRDTLGLNAAVRSRMSDIHAIVRQVISGYYMDGTPIGIEFRWYRAPLAEVEHYLGGASQYDFYDISHHYGYTGQPFSPRNYKIWEKGGLQVESGVVGLDFLYDFRASA